MDIRFLLLYISVRCVIFKELSTTKLLQKSGMRKNVVIDLIYRGFI